MGRVGELLWCRGVKVLNKIADFHCDFFLLFLIHALECWTQGELLKPCVAGAELEFPFQLLERLVHLVILYVVFKASELELESAKALFWLVEGDSASLGNFKYLLQAN